jgi:hypothetical protein
VPARRHHLETSSSSLTGKRDRTDSLSPGGTRKQVTRGGTYGLTTELRESEVKWHDRAARATEDLRKLQNRYWTLEKESKTSRTKWESERTQIIAEKAVAEADADRHKTAAEAADEDCVRAYQAKEEAEARLVQETEARSALEMRVASLAAATEKACKEVADKTGELEALHRDANYIVPAGRLKLAHVPSYSDRGTVGFTRGARAEKASYTKRARHRVPIGNRGSEDLAAGWQLMVDGLKAKPDLDVHKARCATVKVAVDEMTKMLVKQVGHRMAGVRSGNSLADDLTGLH